MKFIKDNHIVHKILDRTKKEMEIIYNLYNNPNVIFDIGANVGVYSLLFSEYYPNSIIYAFEPVVENYKILIKHIEMNNIKNIKPFNIGFYSRSGKYRMIIPKGRNILNTGLYKLDDSNEYESCVTGYFDTINNFIKQHNINKADLVKIDVENCEYDILSNGITFFKHTNLFNIEFYNEPPELKSLLIENGFNFIKEVANKNQIWINKTNNIN